MAQTIEDLGRLVKSKHPGDYDDMPDADLGRKVQTKYPGAYDDFTPIAAKSDIGQDSKSPSESSGVVSRLRKAVLGSKESGDTLIGRALGQSFEPEGKDRHSTWNVPLAHFEDAIRPADENNPADKIGTGIGRGAASIASSFTTPVSAAIMAATGGVGKGVQLLGKGAQAVIPRLISGGFAADMIHGLVQSYPEVRDAIKSGDLERATTAITKFGGQAAMAGAAGFHAARGHAAGPEVDKARDTNNVPPPGAVADSSAAAPPLDASTAEARQAARKANRVGARAIVAPAEPRPIVAGAPPTPVTATGAVTYDPTTNRARVSQALPLRMSNPALDQMLKTETGPKRAEYEMEARRRGMAIPEIPIESKVPVGAIEDSTDYYSLFDEADNRSKFLAAKRSRQAPVVPETGTPEDVARAEDARESLAGQLVGKAFRDTSPSERVAIDDLIAQGYRGRPGEAFGDPLKKAPPGVFPKKELPVAPAPLDVNAPPPTVAERRAARLGRRDNAQEPQGILPTAARPTDTAELPEGQSEFGPVKGSEPSVAEAPTKGTNENLALPADGELKHKFSSTQVQMPDEIAGPIREVAKKIAPEDLADDGVENDVHATVKYGTESNDPADVHNLLAGEGPIKVKLGKVSLFKNEDADVLKMDVDSPDLHRLNKKVSDALPHGDSHPEYLPHVTIAYLKPGMGDKYLDIAKHLEGKETTINEATFSDRNGGKTQIPMGEKPTDASSAPPEPWQQTKEQMGLVEPKIPASPRPLAKTYGKAWRDRPDVEQIQKEYNRKAAARSRALAAHKDYVEASNDHYNGVKQALADGKPVPAEVRSDYSHLEPPAESPTNPSAPAAAEPKPEFTPEQVSRVGEMLKEKASSGGVKLEDVQKEFSIDEKAAARLMEQHVKELSAGAGEKLTGDQQLTPDPEAAPGKSDQQLTGDQPSDGKTPPGVESKAPPGARRTDGAPGKDSPIAAMMGIKGGSERFTSTFGGLVDAAKNSLREKLGIPKPGDPASHTSGGASMKTKLVRNLSELEEMSPPSHERALKTAGSAGKSAVIFKAAVPRITKEFPNWELFSSVLVEGRLRGARSRYQKMAANVGSLSNAELESHAPALYGILDAIDGKADGEAAPILREGMTERVMKHFQADDFDGARKEFADIFDAAAGQVARVHLGPDPKAFEKITADPKFQKALAIYKSDIESHVAQNHLDNEGYLTDALGPLDTYYPLIAEHPEGAVSTQTGRATPYRKGKNTANKFATGFSETYSLGLDGFRDKLKFAIKSNNRAAMLQTLMDTGVGEKLPDGAPVPALINVNGTDYQAVVKQVGVDRQIVAADGSVQYKRAPRAIFPKSIAKELDLMLEFKDHSPNLAQRIGNAVTVLSLAGPTDAVWHGRNILGTLVANTPYLGKDFSSKMIGGVPMTKMFTAFAKALQVDMESPETLAKLHRLADMGQVPDRYASETYSKRIAEQTGAHLNRKSLGPALFGPNGLDIRGRVIMLDIADAMNPGASPAQISKFVGQLGNYTRDLQGTVERGMKESGWAPFYTASSTMMRNGINAWLGTSPFPDNAGKKWASGDRAGAIKERGKNVLGQQLTGGAIGLVASWVAANKVMTGQYPWEDKRSKFLQVRVSDEFRKSPSGLAIWGKDVKKDGYVDLTYFSPLVGRGARALGVRGAIDTAQAGGSSGQQFESGLKDSMNSATHPFISGPVVPGATIALAGVEPYITSLRDPVRGGNTLRFMPASKVTKPGLDTIEERAKETALNVNPFIQSVATSAGLTHKSEFDRGNRLLRMATDLAAPGLLASAYSVFAAEKSLARERQITQRSVDKQENLAPPGAGRRNVRRYRKAPPGVGGQ